MVVLLMVMELMAAITGDRMESFLDFSLGEKFGGNSFPGQKHFFQFNCC